MMQSASLRNWGITAELLKCILDRFNICAGKDLILIMRCRLCWPRNRQSCELRPDVLQLASDAD